MICAPPSLLPIDFLRGFSKKGAHPFSSVRVSTRVEDALAGADVVITLRIQTERQAAGHIPSLREYSKLYGITPSRMELAAPDAFVLHPGPMNEGVEIDSAVAHGPRSMIEEQVTNGVAIRMAVLYGLNGELVRSARQAGAR